MILCLLLVLYPQQGPVHALTRLRMAGKFPDVSDHIQGVLKDGRHHCVESSFAPPQGAPTGEHHLRGGAVRHAVPQGGAQTDKVP